MSKGLETNTHTQDSVNKLWDFHTKVEMKTLFSERQQ